MDQPSSDRTRAVGVPYDTWQVSLQHHTATIFPILSTEVVSATIEDNTYFDGLVSTCREPGWRCEPVHRRDTTLFTTKANLGQANTTVGIDPAGLSRECTTRDQHDVRQAE
ncbi:hypothetical protein D3C72_1525820 [compost metagenome]